MLSPTEEIKAKLDIVDVVSEYVPLKQAGVNFKACCPFHEEKTPSFMVNRERQYYHCFGCNESGDIFTFVQKMENIEFPEALRILAQKTGVQLPEYNPKIQNLKTRLLDIQTEAARFFYAQLLNSEAGKRAYKYLSEKRKLKDETILDWKIGYALDSWESLSKYLKGKGFTDEEILQSGLVSHKQGGRDFYDRFRDRVMFTIVDHHGNIVGFTGRAMKSDEPAKYVNSPQTLVYNKSEVIFGLFQAKELIKKEDKVVIVEGNMDVIASHQAGIKNVVAVSGTALTKEQLQLLQRFTKNIVFCFDSDEAGVRAARRSIELAWGEDVGVRVVAIDPGVAKDPDELVQKDVSKWKELIKSAPRAMDYFFNRYLLNLNKNDIDSKKNIAKELLNLIKKLSSPIEQDHYIKRLAGELGVEESALREAIDRDKPKLKAVSRRDSYFSEITKGHNLKQDRRILMAERLISYMVDDADFAAYISENLELDDLPKKREELYKAMIVYYTKKYQTGAGRDKLVEYVENERPDLIDQFNSVFLLADEISGTYNVAMEEIKKIISFLKKDKGKTRAQVIQKKIVEFERRLQNVNSVTERMQIEKELKDLLSEFDKISSLLR